MGPLSRSRRIALPEGELRSFRFPGRWMDDGALEGLRKALAFVARERLGDLPPYGVFAPGRAPFRNRIVNLLYRDGEAAPAAFSALVHCPVPIDGRCVDVVNLGLAIARPNGAASTSLLRLYRSALVQHWFLRWCRPFWIATFTAKPRTVGAIVDGFTDVWPDYRGRGAPTPRHRGIAAAVFAQARQDSGVGPAASFDAQRFVVHGSCTGPSELLREPFDVAPKHAVEAVNAFCREQLDYETGDEFLLVGKANLDTAWRSLRRHVGHAPC